MGNQKTLINDSLINGLDEYFAQHQFARTRRHSPVYERHLGDSIQSIDVVVEMRPRDSPSALAAIYPWMNVSVPVVDGILREMIQGDEGLLPGISRGTLKQPIEFTSANRASARWYIADPEDLGRIVAEIASFISRWTLPFLAAYKSAEDIVSADAKGDQRVIRDRAQMLRVVAAAYVHLGHAAAKELAETFFGAPGLRKRYRTIFEYLTNPTPPPA